MNNLAHTLREKITEFHYAGEECATVTIEALEELLNYIDVLEAKFIESPDAKKSALEMAHMAGQGSAGVDPGFSIAQEYSEKASLCCDIGANQVQPDGSIVFDKGETSLDANHAFFPFLKDRADGVRGHYAIGRYNPGKDGNGYWEYWNLVSHKWASCSDKVLSLNEATELMKKLVIPSTEKELKPVCYVNGEQLWLCNKSPFHEEKEPMLNGLPRNLGGQTRPSHYCNTPLFTYPVSYLNESIVLSKDQVQEIFLANGFTVKDGQTDLKQYVYDAAYALINFYDRYRFDIYQQNKGYAENDN